MNDDRNTALHWAALNGHARVADALVRAGASPSALNSAEVRRRGTREGGGHLPAAPPIEAREGGTRAEPGVVSRCHFIPSGRPTIQPRCGVGIHPHRLAFSGGRPAIAFYLGPFERGCMPPSACPLLLRGRRTALACGELGRNWAANFLPDGFRGRGGVSPRACGVAAPTCLPPPPRVSAPRIDRFTILFSYSAPLPSPPHHRHPFGLAR